MVSCGVILSGGKSSRMGTNKSLLQLDNKPVIEQIADELKKCTDKLIINANDRVIYDFLHLPIIADRYVEKGPLAGIETALYHVDADLFFIAACDMPFINEVVYRYLQTKLDSYDAVIPVYGNYMHPLAGIYHKRILTKIQAQLDQNALQIKRLFDHCKVNFVHTFENIPDNLLRKHFFNMNDPRQYEIAKTF